MRYRTFWPITINDRAVDWIVMTFVDKAYLQGRNIEISIIDA